MLEGCVCNGWWVWCCEVDCGWVELVIDWCGVLLDGWKVVGVLLNCCEWVVWNGFSGWVKLNCGCCCWGKCNGLYCGV